MNIFLVGGTVRDRLLGLPVNDHDYVVVGATPEQMLALGFRPIGKDFPVFLHPHTHEEYALARTERKTGVGYRGFTFYTSPTITLEDDLRRRDLTINAMAQDDTGKLIDPFGGQQDLHAKVLRHVSPAFAEDPVRILRVARFAARFPHFTVAKETLMLMRKIVDQGEVDHLVAERIWQELSRGFMGNQPSRMLRLLNECGALARVLPELQDALIPTLAMIDQASQRGVSLPVRFAVLSAACDPAVLPLLCARLKVPTDVRDIALMTCREQSAIQDALQLSAAALVDLLLRCDALRRPQRFMKVLEAMHILLHKPPPCYPNENDYESQPLSYLQAVHQAVQQVNAGEIAKMCGKRENIAQKIHAERVAAARISHNSVHLKI